VIFEDCVTMRTLVIGPNDNPPLLGKYTSGLDRVAQLHAAKPDHWLMTAEGDTIHPRQVKLGIANICFPERGNPQVTLRKNWVKENHHRFDRFIYHGNSSTIIKALCKEGRGADIEAWLHCPDVNSVWGFNFNSGVGLVKHKGGRVIAVSERLRLIWDAWHRYQIGREQTKRVLTSPDLCNMTLLHDPFVDEVRFPLGSTCRDPVKPAALPGIVLSRMAKEKKLERALGNGLNFMLSRVSRGYVLDTTGESVVFDQPWETCMEVLAESAFLVSTWEDETYGLNALEAAERGVPVILCEGVKPIPRTTTVLPHASRSFLPDWGYITCHPSPEGVKDAISRIPKEWTTLTFRRRLARYIREKVTL